MAQLQTKWIADDAVNDLKVKLRNDQALRARNAADTADVELLKLTDQDVLDLRAGTTVGGEAIALASDIPSTFSIQGNWDADTNTPTLVSGTNDTGDDFPLYIVSVSGDTTIDGFNDWVAGDKIYFASGQWWKVDNNEAVTSVNSKIGAVELDTDDIDEGTTNLYHTVARARGAAVVDSTAGNETDQAASVAAMKAFVSSSSQSFRFEQFNLNAQNITDGYVDLIDIPISGSLIVHVQGGLVLSVGEYFMTGDGSRFEFSGDFVNIVSAGDILNIQYAY